MTWLSHSFALPWVLLLLALLPGFGVLEALSTFAVRRRLRNLGNASLVNGLKVPAPRWRHLRYVCQGMAFMAVVVGLAGPRWGRDTHTQLAPGRDVIAVLDMSRSMLAQDVVPNRFERARQALDELSRDLESRGGHRLGLVAFAARAREVCPLTPDYGFFRAALAELDAANLPAELRPKSDQPGSGTRIGAALRTAVDAQEPEATGYQDIMLLSDGDDPSHDEEWRQGVIIAKARGIPVHTIGIGDPRSGSPIPAAGGKLLHHDGRLVLTRLEEEPLKIIAKATGGTYTPAQTNELPLGRLFREHIEPAGTREGQEEALPSLQQRYAWFMGSGFILLGLDAIVGSLWTRSSRRRAQSHKTANATSPTGVGSQILLVTSAILLLAASPNYRAEALIRKGNQAFAAEDFGSALDAYCAAEDRTTDPGLVAFNKAAALYQLRRYREAEMHYRRSAQDAAGSRRQQILYGLANCLVLQAAGRDIPRLREAIHCYETCLESPSLALELKEDACHNLELARILLASALARSPRENPPPEQDTIDSKPPEGDRKMDDMSELLTRGDVANAGQSGPVPLAAQGESETQSMRNEQSPGKGTLGAIPDEDKVAPLTPEDALDHLKDATTRIQRERREFRKTSIPATLPHVLDW